MCNLANTYFALGRQQDGLAMQEKSLEFQRRVLAKNHPDIGHSCWNISINSLKVGDFHRALKMAREALRIFQTTLPPSHPHVQQAQQLLRHCEGVTARRL